MKSITDNGAEIAELANGVLEFDAISAKAICCMMIDAVAAKNGEDPVKVIETMRDLIREVNTKFGPLRL